MIKWVCSVCGYTVEGPSAPDKCPQCGAPASKFNKVESGQTVWAAEHVVGVAQGVDPAIVQGLRENYMGECTEVGMYLAMSRQADREGYPEVAEAYKRIAFEEAEHAAKFAEMLGEVVYADTKTAGKVELAKLAKAQGLDAIHDSVHEMARDEARHGKAFIGLLNRYFK